MENVCYFLKNTYLRCDRLVHRILPDRENNMSKDRPYYRIKWIRKKKHNRKRRIRHADDDGTFR